MVPGIEFWRAIIRVKDRRERGEVSYINEGN